MIFPADFHLWRISHHAADHRMWSGLMWLELRDVFYWLSAGHIRSTRLKFYVHISWLSFSIPILLAKHNLVWLNPYVYRLNPYNPIYIYNISCCVIPPIKPHVSTSFFSSHGLPRTAPAAPPCARGRAGGRCPRRRPCALDRSSRSLGTLEECLV